MKKLAIIAAILYSGRFAFKLYMEIHAQILVERFPDLPEKLVREAHVEMFKRALTDQSFEPETEEELDAHLRELVAEKLRHV